MNESLGLGCEDLVELGWGDATEVMLERWRPRRKLLYVDPELVP
jgi:hypothetical protein